MGPILTTSAVLTSDDHAIPHEHLKLPFQKRDNPLKGLRVLQVELVTAFKELHAGSGDLLLQRLLIGRRSHSIVPSAADEHR